MERVRRDFDKLKGDLSAPKMAGSSKRDTKVTKNGVHQQYSAMISDT